jgi:CheY-like chemotaxis protein
LQGGLGLGLTLVRRLIEMHGGSVEARSAGLGKGSEFIVRLPALPASAAAPLPPPRPSAARQGAVQVDRVLVVDDNPDVAESLVMLLEGLTHEVRTAGNGPQALGLARDYRPDLILCDIGLPGMDGCELARRLRQEPGLENVLLVAVSGYGQEEDRRRSQEAGFDRHLVKPIGRAVLEELVRDAITAREQSRPNR